jgi:hypothetical protein
MDGISRDIKRLPRFAMAEKPKRTARFVQAENQETGKGARTRVLVVQCARFDVQYHRQELDRKQRRGYADPLPTFGKGDES